MANQKAAPLPSGIDTSRAIDLSKPVVPEIMDIGYKESIYNKEVYKLELRYGCISGIQILNKAILVKSEAAQAVIERCGSCQQQPVAVDTTLSKDFKIIRVRLHSLLTTFGELFDLERQLGAKGAISSTFDPEERHQIGLEITHCMKKMAEIRGVTGKVEIVDSFYESAIKDEKPAAVERA